MVYYMSDIRVQSCTWLWWFEGYRRFTRQMRLLTRLETVITESRSYSHWNRFDQVLMLDQGLVEAQLWSSGNPRPEPLTFSKRSVTWFLSCDSPLRRTVSGTAARAWNPLWPKRAESANLASLNQILPLQQFSVEDHRTMISQGIPFFQPCLYQW